MIGNRTIRVGIDNAPPPPMQLGNPETGDFRGYEVDLLNELSQRAGFRLSFRRHCWSVIVRELITGDSDLVCSAATITTERERQVDFCLPHLAIALAVVNRAGISPGVTINGLRLGVRRATTAEAYLKQHTTGEIVRISESNEDLYAFLGAGKLDAVVDDSPIAKWFCRSVSGLQFGGILAGTDAAYAIMVRKGNDKLRAEINTSLSEMANDGTRQRLIGKWFSDLEIRSESSDNSNSAC